MNWQMGICVFYLSTRESIENRPIWVISKGSFCHQKRGGGGVLFHDKTKVPTFTCNMVIRSIKIVKLLLVSIQEGIGSPQFQVSIHFLHFTRHISYAKSNNVEVIRLFKILNDLTFCTSLGL